MAGSIFPNINASVTSGNQLATLLNDFKDLVASGASGTARPTNLQAGGMWVDTTNAASPNFYWEVKVYTGTTDVVVYRINIQTNTASFAGADSSFVIERVSADTSAPILRFLKERVANQGQTLAGDYVGEIQFMAAGDDNSNPIVARIRSVAAENTTATNAGAHLVFETTAAGSTALAEAARILDGKFGVGTTAPEAGIHVAGLSGVLVDQVSDNTTGAQIVARKKRVTSLGQVLSGDTLGEVTFKSTDNVGATLTGASIVSTASEHHTTTAHGTDVQVKAKSPTTTTLTTVATFKGSGRVGIGTTGPGVKFHVVEAGGTVAKFEGDATGGAVAVTNGTDELSLKALSTGHGFVHAGAGKALILGSNGANEVMRIDSTGKIGIGTTGPNVKVDVVGDFALRKGTDVATAGTVSDVATTNTSLLRFTNATTISSLANPQDGKFLILTNATSGVVLIKNDSGGTAANRILTGTGNDLNLKQNASLLLCYDITALRWRVIGGAGGGQQSEYTSTALTAGGTITLASGDGEHYIAVGSAAGNVALSTTPFGVTAPPNMTKVILTGTDDINSVTLTYNDAAKGLVGNFSTIELTKYKQVTCVYLSTFDRWVVQG